MIEVSCPKCNRILMVYNYDFVFDDDFRAKALCCDEVFYVSYESDFDCDDRRLKERDADVTIDTLEWQIKSLKETIKKLKGPAPHSWTKETMPECRKVFMNSIMNAYWNISDNMDKADKIFELLKQFAGIERTVK